MPLPGPLEMIIVGMLALIVFGPEKLPQIARTVGRTLHQLRQVASEVRSEFESGLSVDDEPEEEAPRPATDNRRPAGRSEES